MRSLIVICFIAVACAGEPGYNYQPVGQSAGGLSFNSGLGSFGGGVSSGSLATALGGLGLVGRDIGSLGGAQGLSANRVGNLGGGGLGSFGGSSLGGLAAGSLGVNNGATYDAPAYNTPVEIEKEFYTFSAPESEFDDGNAEQKIAGSVKKGLRVIFIKGPENRGFENAAIALAKQAAEQKTAIYVLSKQADITDLAKRFNAIDHSNNNNKPEVHFVKYRTPEDAANAQKAIEGQYNSLGGSSQSHNGGVAPVLNFASQAPVRTAPAHAPNNAYLPSSIFRN